MLFLYFSHGLFFATLVSSTDDVFSKGKAAIGRPSNSSGTNNMLNRKFFVRSCKNSKLSQCEHFYDRKMLSECQQAVGPVSPLLLLLNVGLHQHHSVVLRAGGEDREVPRESQLFLHQGNLQFERGAAAFHRVVFSS